MVQVVAGGIVYEVTLEDMTKLGAATVKVSLKELDQEAKKTDLSFRSLTREGGMLGGSLSALGGSAMVAGTAIGGDLGRSLQTAGMGVGFVGSGISTLIPALRTLAVVTQGQIIPTILELGASMKIALPEVVAIGAAIGVLSALAYGLMNTDLGGHFDTVTRSVEENIEAMDKLNDKYTEYLDLQKELAGIPEELEDIDREIKGVGLDLDDLNKEISKRPSELVEKRQDLGIAAFQAEESYQKALEKGEPLQVAATKRARDKAMQAFQENEELIAGEDPELARLLYRMEVLNDRAEDLKRKREEVLAKQGKLPKIIEEANIEAAMEGIRMGAMPVGEEMVQITPGLRPGAGMGVTGMTTPIQVTNYITVQDAGQVRKITEDSIQLARDTTLAGFRR